ncbi:MAG: hypothetical protein GY820_17785 [Gammaproteobacteria bacterium]|nr:hypothetical protein [Gammaproteobacteria bacterium]
MRPDSVKHKKVFTAGYEGGNLVSVWAYCPLGRGVPKNILRCMIDSAVTALQKVTNYDMIAEAKQSNGTTINKMNGYAQIENCTNRKNSLPTEW